MSVDRMRPALLLMTVLVALSQIEARAGSSAQAGIVSAERPSPPRVPAGYDPRPPGTQLRVREPKPDGPGFTVEVTNDGPRTVTELSFLAIVERVGWRQPVRLLRSEPFSVTLVPGATTRLESAWLSAGELDALRAAGAEPIQIFFSPDTIRYDDGSAWRVTVANPGALDHVRTLGVRR